MSNKQLINQLVLKFLHESCAFLGVDDSQIGISFLQMPFKTSMVFLLKESDDIVIDTNFINKIVDDNIYDELRTRVYIVSRQIYQRRKMVAADGINNTESNELDSKAFALALCMLNGIKVRIPTDLKKDLEPNMLRILDCEFKENCQLFSESDPDSPNVLLYKIKKTKKAQKIETKRHTEVKPAFYAIDVDNDERGSKANPFNDVIEACQFIKEQEIKAFELDKYMSETLAKRKFNYLYDKNIYNINWADGKVAYCHPEIPKEAFIVNQLQSGKFSFKPNLYGRKFLYRGQSRFYEKCTPGLFRDPEQQYYLKEQILYDELRIILFSHPLIHLFEKGFCLYKDQFRFEVNYKGLAQHYYQKTSCLDLTSDMEAAKFFAVTDYNHKEDRYYPHVETEDLGVMYYYELAEPGAFHYKPQQHLSTIGKQLFMRSGNQHGFLLNMDRTANFNLFPQVHMVFFRHNPIVSQKIFLESRNGSRYFPIDMLQIQWKRFLQQFETNNVVSLDAVKINIQDNIKESLKSICYKLEDLYGIKVDKSIKPRFDHDLIDKYFEDIKNGWWQEVFCKDIYFGSSDGIVYENMLKMLPKNQNYAQYFTRRYM